jgi:salicylate hydroxylase
LIDDGTILIAGGGIGGLAVAIALAGQGRRVRVLEQRRDAGEEGAGIQIGPNGVHALRGLGVAERLEACVARPQAIAIFDGRSGRMLNRLPLTPRMEATFGAPYWVTRRADLHAALLDEARSRAEIEMTTGFLVEKIEREPGRIQVRSGNGLTAAGAALIGADGLWSTVAQQVLGAAVPRSAGRTAARTLIPSGKLSAPFDAAITGLWLGPKAHLVHYPVQRGAFLNVVAIFDGGAEETGWGQSIDATSVSAGFAGWSGTVCDLIGAAPEWRRWSLFERADLAQWSDGPVSVVGDAAHPVLPFLAQGAVMALEDAVALAAAVADQPHDLAGAFRDYADTRRSRVQRVARASRRNGQIYHLAGPAALARNAVLSWLPPERLIAGYDWLYGH